MADEGRKKRVKRLTDFYEPHGPAGASGGGGELELPPPDGPARSPHGRALDTRTNGDGGHDVPCSSGRGGVPLHATRSACRRETSMASRSPGERRRRRAAAMTSSFDGSDGQGVGGGGGGAEDVGVEGDGEFLPRGGEVRG